MTTMPPYLDPTKVFSWMQSFAPQSLYQPILPTYNVTNINSSAPQTEARIVTQHSYGRQIGRLSDAVHALIAAQYPKGAPAGPLRRFEDLWREIEALKVEDAASRLERVAQDLKTLKQTDGPKYLEAKRAIEEALKGV